MALTDSTKVDYLWKKVGYGLTKTDTPENKEAFNESIASPLLIRGDKVWAESGNIPGVQPTSGNTSVVAIYNDSGNGAATVECTEDITASDNRTWKTGITDWISPEFGSTYLVKVYVANSSVSNPQSVGTQLFQAGSGNDDEWFFDYQSGVVNFNGANIPSDIATGITGKSVYVAGAVYIGDFGVGSGSTLGNLQVNDTTLTTVNANANIILEPDGTGTVQINSTSSFTLPVGNTSQRPASADSGAIRYNSETTNIEFYDGSAWTNIAEGGTIESQTISPDGSSTQFDLDNNTTADAILVTLNGVSQIPNSSYSVAGNVITFTETPTTDDIIEVRFFGVSLTAEQQISYGKFSRTTDQAVGNVDTAIDTVFNSSGNRQNINLDGSDASKIVFSEAGLYNITVNAQLLSTNSSAKDVRVWLAKDGTNLSGSLRVVSLASNNEYKNLPLTHNVSMTANSYIQVKYASTDTAVSLKAAPSTAYAPASNSIDVIITQPAL